MSVSAYPLAWPDGRPRKPDGLRKRARFNKQEYNGRYTETKSLTVADALSRLQHEIDMVGGRYPVVSSNLEVRLDGFPRSGQPEPKDPAVALYFDLDNEPHCMPCDTYDRVADNIAAIAKHIEATRSIDRFGVATVSEMFAGFVALPAPGSKRPWRAIFGYHEAQNPSRSEMMATYRDLARKKHPDAGGTEAAMAELNQARADALMEIGE